MDRHGPGLTPDDWTGNGGLELAAIGMVSWTGNDSLELAAIEMVSWTGNDG